MFRLTARRCVAGLAGSAVVLASGWVAAPSAWAAGTFVVSQVRYSTPSITLSGLALAPFSVTLRVQASPPLPSTQHGDLLFVMQRSGGQGQQSILDLCGTLVSGDGADGQWIGTIPMASTDDGSWTLTAVDSGAGCGGFENMPVPHPVVGEPILTVTGSHQPVVTFATVPDPVPLTLAAFTVAGRVSDRDTGQPYAGVTVTWAGVCKNDLFGASARSDAAGHFAITQSAGSVELYDLNCVVTLYSVVDQFNPQFYTNQGFQPRLLAAVTAVPSQTTVRVGTIVPVNGTVTGFSAQCPLALQRLHGATAWRTVSTGYVRTSGRYTVLAQPPNRGYNIYRTYMPACTLVFVDFAPATSRAFAITGT
jgi:hypothetical protein